MGNRAFYAIKALFTSKLVSRRAKLKLYWTVIRPVVVYGCETWVLKENIIQKLSVFERKILRKVFRQPKKKDGSWKIKKNIELDNLTLGLLMSDIYGAPILDVSRSHTTTQHSR